MTDYKKGCGYIRDRLMDDLLESVMREYTPKIPMFRVQKQKKNQPKCAVDYVDEKDVRDSSNKWEVKYMKVDRKELNQVFVEEHWYIKVIADVYPESVKVLFMTLGQYSEDMLLIEWTSINPKVIQSLRRACVPFKRRSREYGSDYELPIVYESVLRLHLSMYGQKMICVRACKNQTHFKRRH
jgi:hypothetical protein